MPQIFVREHIGKQCPELENKIIKIKRQGHIQGDNIRFKNTRTDINNQKNGDINY
ncbi:MAG: hypothetical protein K0R26_1315 [Bacteroidota bacterium]|nr:hypothetical protein [Bacteroidota bacterium]